MSWTTGTGKTVGLFSQSSDIKVFMIYLLCKCNMHHCCCTDLIFKFCKNFFKELIIVLLHLCVIHSTYAKNNGLQHFCTFSILEVLQSMEPSATSITVTGPVGECLQAGTVLDCPAPETSSWFWRRIHVFRLTYYYYYHYGYCVLR